MKTQDYLKLIGVRDLSPRTIPFDPGYDAHTIKEHLRQSSHLMAGFKISMACWQIANEDVTREKIACCDKYGVKTCAGGGPLEIAAAFDQLEAYMDLCADVGLHRIEAGEGIVVNNLQPERVVGMAHDRGLEVQFELGEKSRIAGRSGRKVRIIPRDHYRYGYNLWLEEQSALLLKWELLDSNQNRLAKLMFTDLRLGSEVDLLELKSTSQLQDFKTLESSLPPGNSLSHSKPNWQADKLPPGFHLTAHRQLGQQEQPVYEHLVYSDGLAAVSVYVEGNRDGSLSKDTGISRMGTTHAFSRSADGVLITVVGDVPAATVRAIGESVKFKSP